MRTTYILEDLFYNMSELEDACQTFYKRMSELLTDKEAVELFEHLSSKESKNKKYFDDFTRDMDYVLFLEDEYVAYLRVFLHNNFIMFRYRSKFNTIDEYLRTVIHMEKDMLILLLEAKKMLGVSAPEIFDKMLSDKRKHLKILFEYFEKVESLEA